LLQRNRSVLYVQRYDVGAYLFPVILFQVIIQAILCFFRLVVVNRKSARRTPLSTVAVVSIVVSDSFQPTV
jgi:hypothetical protein